MKILKVPSQGIISIESCSGGITSYVPITYGSVNIDVDHIVYYRDCNENSGMIRVSTGVDIVLSKEWYDTLCKKLDDLGEIL
jgi:hypothetical protein